MSRRNVLGLLGVLMLPAAASAAEQVPTTPPPVLVISREEIKPGSMGAHEKQVTSYLALFNKANVGGYRLGMVPVSGDDNQVLYLERYQSFADLEANRKKFDETFATSPALQSELEALELKAGPMHATQKTSIAVYREDLSYRPNKPDEVAKARYMNVFLVRVKPGQGTDYEDLVKQSNAARAKANLDEHTAAFSVITGAPSGTYMFLSTNRSLTEWDEFRKNFQARNKAIDEALGGELVARQRRAAIAEVVAESWSTLYAFDPKISRPAPWFADFDPDFWKPKAPAVKK